jgi:hypothetical protein
MPSATQKNTRFSFSTFFKKLFGYSLSSKEAQNVQAVLADPNTTKEEKQSWLTLFFDYLFKKKKKLSNQNLQNVSLKQNVQNVSLKQNVQNVSPKPKVQVVSPEPAVQAQQLIREYETKTKTKPKKIEGSQAKPSRKKRPARLLQERMLHLANLNIDPKIPTTLPFNNLLYTAFFIYLNDRFSPKAKIIFTPFIKTHCFAILQEQSKAIAKNKENKEPQTALIQQQRKFLETECKFDFGIFLRYDILKFIESHEEKQGISTFLAQHISRIIQKNDSSSTAILVFPVTLYYHSSADSTPFVEATVLIYRNYSLEWYDPQGMTDWPQTEIKFLYETMHNTLLLVRDNINRYFKEVKKTNQKLRYFNLAATCPVNANFGIVNLRNKKPNSNEQNGSCTIWSFFFVEYAIRYPKLTPETFISKMHFSNVDKRQFDRLLEKSFFMKISRALIHKFNTILVKNFDISLNDILQKNEKASRFEEKMAASMKNNKYNQLFTKFSSSSRETYNSLENH